MKGNILVSSPARGNKTTCMTPQARTGEGQRGMESETEMVLRLIQEKTAVTIPLEDVVACHPMGKREKNTFVVRIINRKPGSAWELLTASMMKPSGMDKQKNVFLNYQLTKDRAALAKAVRQAKTDGKILAYSVDQNGKVKIKKIGSVGEYTTVTSEENMNGMLQ